MYASLTILIAQTDSRLQSFSGGFRKNRAQIDSGDVVLLLVGLIVVCAVLWLVARWSERRVRRDSSLGLFLTLANAHRIDWYDRFVLWRLARARHVAEPALLFIDPRLTSPEFTGQVAARSAARIKAFRRQVFSGIDRANDDQAEATELEDCTSLTPPQSPAEPAVSQPPYLAQNLADMLGESRVLQQPDRRPHKQQSVVSPPAEQAEKPRTAEFPASTAPSLDLYPWLGDDWTIAEADE